MNKTNIFVILFMIFILTMSSIYTLIITQINFTPEELEILESVPTMNPLPVFLIVLVILFIILLIGSRDIKSSKKVKYRKTN